MKLLDAYEKWKQEEVKEPHQWVLIHDVVPSRQYRVTPQGDLYVVNGVNPNPNINVMLSLGWYAVPQYKPVIPRTDS